MNASSILNCSVTDSSGLASGYQLSVYLNAPGGYYSFLNNSCAASSCTLIANLMPTSSRQYSYVLTETLKGQQYLVTSDYLDFTGGTNYWGPNGLLLSLILVLVLALIGFATNSPSLGIVMMLVGVVGAKFVGALPINDAELIGLGVVCAALLYKLRN